MNILFISIYGMKNLEAHSIYPDLLRQFRDKDHRVYIVSPHERRTNLYTETVATCGMQVLYVRTGNITKCSVIEKGITTVLIAYQYKKAIKKYFPNVHFDLVLYPTPPITFESVVKFIKKRDAAKSYLLLKDIFPQNALDIGIMSKSGIKGLLYKYFRKKEKKLYSLSDRIGCMSLANVEYVLRHNPEISKEKVEVCPNSIEIRDMTVSPEDRTILREKYEIPIEKKIFVYGGNLGKPQGISFLIECLRATQNIHEAFFLIVGDGTEFDKLDSFVNNEKPNNVKLIKRLSIEDYDRMIAACDVGLIFLDHRFTIPNFPSRVLAYMQAGLPVFACTDPNTDIGKVITEGGFGWWCESKNIGEFKQVIHSILECTKFDEMSAKGREYLNKHYSVAESYQIIMRYM